MFSGAFWTERAGQFLMPCGGVGDGGGHGDNHIMFRDRTAMVVMLMEGGEGVIMTTIKAIVVVMPV